MKKILLFLFAALCLSSCGGDSNLTSAIPANAQMVFCLNTKALVEKANYNPFDSSYVKPIIALMESSLKDKNQITIFDGLVKDINSCGLDIKGESFGYIKGDTIGYVVRVNDLKKFNNLLTTLNLIPKGSLKAVNGAYSFTQGSGAMVWDENRLLIIACKSDADCSKLALAQMKQGKSESIASVDAFKEMMKEKKDISFYQSAASYGSNVGLKIPLAAKGLRSISFLSFEKGEIVLSSRVLFDNKASEQKYNELRDKISSAIKGDQLGYISPNPILAVSINMNGKAVLDYIKSLKIDDLMNTIAGQYDETGNKLKLENILNDIAGDITFSLNADKKPNFLAMLDIKDPKVFSDLLDSTMLKNKNGAKKLSPTSYLIKADSAIGGMYVTLDNNRLCITNQETLQKGNTEFSSAKGTYLLFHFSTDKLPQLFDRNEAFNTFAAIIAGGDGTIDRKSNTATLKLKFRDKNKNSLAQLCSYIDSQKASLMSLFGRYQ